jgi:succinoglycan biosynthesis transport protein ExoP
VDAAQHLAVIWRRKWAVLGISAVIAALVFFYTSQQPKVFQANATVILTPARGASAAGADEATTSFLTKSYAALAETRPVTSAADRLSKLKLGADEASRRLKVSSATAGFIAVRATGPSRDDATRLARGEAQALLDAVRAQQKRDLESDVGPINTEIADLEQRLATLPPLSSQRGALESRYNALVTTMTQRRLESVDRLELVGDARPDGPPVAPQTRRTTMLGFLLALVVNAELFVLLERLGDRFSQQDLDLELRELTGLTVLSHIPDNHDELAEEAFNGLRTNLLFMDLAKQLRTVAIVSVDPSAGKSFTAIGLARSVAKLDVNTLLVDGDLRRPVLHERLGLRRVPGLTDVINGLPLSQALQRTDDEAAWHVIAAGTPANDPAALLGGRQLGLLSSASAAELVIFDTPAEGVFADAASIASQCDATILVVDPRVSRRRAVLATMQRLRQLNANVVGVVVNRSRPNAQALEYAKRGSDGVTTRKSS